VDDAASSVYVPMYCGITEVPQLYARGYGAMMEFEDDAAFWVFNQVSNFVYTRYNIIHPEVDSLQNRMETKFIETTGAIDEAAAKLYKTDKELALEFITDYSVAQGNKTVLKWKDFYAYLFTKYMDGNIKTPVEVPDGYIYQNPTLKQPGYGEEWYRKIVEQTGDHFKMSGDAGH